MRVALISPYSWTYPGGVTRHIEALRGELAAAGHDARVLAPFDHDTRATAVMHRGTRPQTREQPDWLIPLGPTLGWSANGAVSNLTGSGRAVTRLRSELRAGRFDVVHIHEPVTPLVGWDALVSTGQPMVGTFHCYSESRAAHAIAAGLGARRRLNHLTQRIAVVGRDHPHVVAGRHVLGRQRLDVPGHPSGVAPRIRRYERDPHGGRD